jgi:hypothetical protein
MRQSVFVAAVVLCSTLASLPASAEKLKGTTTLKDVQATGVKDKEHKHQVFDLLFATEAKSYACRTDSGKSMNATDFVVGSQVKYEIDGNKVKLQSMQNKKVECKVVRVEATSPTQ